MVTTPPAWRPRSLPQCRTQVRAVRGYGRSHRGERVGDVAGIDRLQQLIRVDGGAALRVDLEMEMVDGRVAGVADGADDLSGLDRHADRDAGVDAGHVCV